MSSLETIDSQHAEETVFRFAATRTVQDFLRERGFDEDMISELHRELSSRMLAELSEDLCARPFRTKSHLRKMARYRTRFSDGSFSVFYGALEYETAKAEVRHHANKNFGRGGKPRTLYFVPFSCEFRGFVKDLRPKRADWPELVSDRDYGFCNELGRQAKDCRIDGLLTPSARRERGTNLPVFRASALMNPSVRSTVAITLRP